MTWVRMSGLYRRDEIAQVVAPGKEWRFVEKQMGDGPVFEVWWRDGETVQAPSVLGCNRHVDCTKKRPGDPCCWTEDCEDCFGK